MYVLASNTTPIKDGDVLVTDINDFMDKVTFFEIEPQKVVIDESFQQEINLLKDSGFETMLLHTYLKILNRNKKEEPATEVLLNEALKVAATLTTEPELEVVETLTTESEPEVKEPEPQEISIATAPKTLREAPKKKKTSFFGKLFAKYSESTNDSEDLTVPDDFANLASRMSAKLTKGQKVKNFLIKNNILTKEQIILIEKEMDDCVKFGRVKKFVQCGRDMHLIGDDDAAWTLSHILGKEFISKTKCKTDKIYKYNAEFLSMLNNFFIYDIDDNAKEITICKDYSDEAKLYIIEQKFMDYKVIILNTVEGVTREVISELKEV